MVMGLSDWWKVELLCLLQLTALEGRERQHKMATLLHFHRLQELTGAGCALVKLPEDTPFGLLSILLRHTSHTPLHNSSIWSGTLPPQSPEQVTGQAATEGGQERGGEGEGDVMHIAPKLQSSTSRTSTWRWVVQR